MISNFTFLLNNKQYESFANACIEAEKSIVVSPATCAILSRRALELAVKWVYSFDSVLRVPYQDNLSSLIHDPNFTCIIDSKLFPLIKYIIKLGNVAVHTNSNISREEAILSLHNLHEFVSWIDYCYSDEYSASEFDENIIQKGEEKRTRPEELKDLYEKLSSKDKKLEEIIKENEKLRKQLTSKREENTQDYTFKVDEISEFETRKRYIDLDLKLAGWDFDKDIQEELKVEGMPNDEGIGFVDYVLFGDNGKPLAIIEAKRTSKDPRKGQQQAKLYADCIEKKYNQRPIIFYTNGFEIYIWDDTQYPERLVSGYYTKDELSLLIDRKKMKLPLDNIKINDDISNRYYQKDAIMAVCDALTQKQRKTLLVMATGSGKTRTAISIVDVLTRHNWVKNILFLADRKTLVTQAKNNFNNLLPNLTLCNLLDNKDNPEESRMVFSTYPTMMNAIDEAKTKDGKKLFTVGHFDLIIIDESHRSIYKKYRAIFEYFDAMLLGLTATPKDEIDKNTYEVFELENNVPTYAYELEQAVEDGYLVDYKTVETKLKFLEEGIKYDELSEEEKEMYEDTFDDNVGEEIGSEALNNWLFNDNTIDQVLQTLMQKGIKIEGGDKLGKTIIFAKNHKHAQRIVERFDKLYPEYKGNYARVIDYSVNYYQTLIDDFSTKNKMPQIAVSVDMLDTGVDIPEVVNLVFFKKVRSKSKFWQMIGRGTRLCKDLFGVGEDKKNFLIFDFCSNFEFFRANPKGIEGKIVQSLTEKIFNIKIDLIKELNHLNYQTDEYIKYRNTLLDEVLNSINSLNEDNFRVRQQLKYVHKFKNKDIWNNLSVIDTNKIKEHISPIIVPLDDDELAKRFDYLMYAIKLASLQNKNATKPMKSVIQTAQSLSKLGTIPQVVEKKDIINKVLTQEFWDEANIFDLEMVREALRDLIKFIEKKSTKVYYTNFEDEILEVSENEALYFSNDLQSYRKKVNQYLNEHKDDLAIYKLRNNKKLTKQDLKTLEHILWTELGSREDYEKEFKDTPITKLVRQIVGLDIKAANEAFSEFLTNENLNANQSKFVKLIVDYIVKNGVMDKKVLQEEPFRTVGSIVELFKDNMDTARKIISVIDEINNNSIDIVGA
ncbi:DEAD/DEAH box helicase family protein [Tepidibacter thalassicus]|uniref:Type I restriction enzyme, R subunit n=1 Tax=Tepidibacter thalassicus DSM 15285 TaxID=1123350 RepID=A0A1M5TFM0_9FIRM|nr:DEAD/DEAH box helicase family protein [Tepidibacter thalassicus]SHH49478.1 type I restriction enzyme, R subunit [Tepidibacter thalassicus DSM 15285]